jgi:hypothetical protein
MFFTLGLPDTGQHEEDDAEGGEEARHREHPEVMVDVDVADDQPDQEDH